MSTSKSFSALLKNFPEKCGVYTYYDQQGVIIYVGKAKNLKKRVKSYFSKNHTSAKLRVLVNKIHDIRFTVVDNEYDALLLENNLIKKHQPRYNVLLKDDKTYPWVCIKNEAFPRIFSTRKKINDGSHYYGPYSSVRTMQILLEVLSELYPFRKCNLNLSAENITKNKYRVCLDYHIKKCKGPCQGFQSAEDYQKSIKNAMNIIEGNTKEVFKELQAEMQGYSKKMEFEKAHEIKEKIELLNKYKAKSTVVNPNIHNVDVFGIVEDDNSAFVSYFKVMNGAIIQTQNIEIKKRLDETKEELLLIAIVDLRKTYFSQTEVLILPFPLSYHIEKTKIILPKQGEKYQLLQLAQRNAQIFMQDIHHKKNLLEGNKKNYNIVEQMQKDLMLPTLPLHIECFDNSNIQGQYAVSAMVCFRNAKPSPKEYRHYLIKSIDQANDFASMQEVIHRRYSRLLKEKADLPNLIVVDGGKGQVSAAYEILEKLGIEDRISLVGIAKRLEEIYRPNDSIALFINKKSETQRVLQQLRDEAHRFGITHHRNLRSHALIKTELTNIQGIGDDTARKLLHTFRSIAKIKNADLNDLIQAIGKKKAQAVFNFYHIFEDKL
ncbi:MAG: excinuclease ABC subunit UvrC [Bacteroidales bacterium]|nr:excinuclease ABC subunit UvrC [Bacteroidales bacterium]